MLPFGIGLTEILMILAVVLLVVGPSKLPEIARTLGKGVRKARQASRELRDAIDIDEPMRKVREWQYSTFVEDVETVENAEESHVGEPGHEDPETPHDSLTVTRDAATASKPAVLSEEPQVDELDVRDTETEKT